MNSQEIATQTQDPLIQTGIADLMTNAPLLAQIDHMAKRMANAKATIPKHLAGSEGDCWAIIMQSIQWKMNPFVVAQKTHLVNGTLGYEAQLVNAVVQSSGMCGRFHYEYEGEGATLKCRVGAVLSGESNVTWGEWLAFKDVKVKNSPLWGTNPKQQMGYLQLKNFARAYTPGAILGVYTRDELEEMPIGEREIGPAKSDLNLVSRETEKAVPADAEILQKEEPEVVAEPLTYAIVAEAINNAQTGDEMARAAQMAGEFTGADENEKFRQELTDLYRARRATIEAKQLAEVVL